VTSLMRTYKNCRSSLDLAFLASRAGPGDRVCQASDGALGEPCAQHECGGPAVAAHAAHLAAYLALETVEFALRGGATPLGGGRLRQCSSSVRRACGVPPVGFGILIAVAPVRARGLLLPWVRARGGLQVGLDRLQFGGGEHGGDVPVGAYQHPLPGLELVGAAHVVVRIEDLAAFADGVHMQPIACRGGVGGGHTVAEQRPVRAGEQGEQAGEQAAGAGDRRVGGAVAGDALGSAGNYPPAQARTVASPGPLSSPSRAGRPETVSASAAAGPRTSSPLPCAHSVSVAT